MIDYRGVEKRDDKYWFGNCRVQSPDPITAILIKTDIPDPNGCWLWRGKTNKAGYGIVNHDGKDKRVHRWFYEIFFGPVDKNKVCCHRCDVRNCINPAHIFIGTRVDNQKDMKEKGRAASGERNGYAKLNWDQVREIRKLQDKKSQKEIGLMYGVKQSHISLIHRNVIWKESI